MSYGITVRLPAAFAPTVERVRAALQDQGFGVLTEIDVRATLREKLGAQIEGYQASITVKRSRRRPTPGPLAPEPGPPTRADLLQ
jgi:hypothetical protein